MWLWVARSLANVPSQQQYPQEAHHHIHARLHLEHYVYMLISWHIWACTSTIASMPKALAASYSSLVLHAQHKCINTCVYTRTYIPRCIRATCKYIICQHATGNARRLQQPIRENNRRSRGRKDSIERKWIQMYAYYVVMPVQPATDEIQYM